MAIQDSRQDRHGDGLQEMRGTDRESARLAALKAYQILDTGRDHAFDAITELAIRIYQVPASTISLVDKDRIWFKSQQGLPVNEIERVPGLCATAIESDGPYLINDASQDQRSCENPLVTGGLGLRFYAAIPLRTRAGHALGTLTIIDTQPRALTLDELEDLKALARVTIELIEHSLAVHQVAALNETLGELNTRLQIQANHDELTSLLNRRATMAQLEKMHALSVREQKPLSLILADLDYFKAINDQYGHVAGDQILVQVAHRLNQVARQSDYVGRIGGEEFMVIMYPCSEADARQVAERIMQEFARAAFSLPNGATVALTVSIGIYSSESREIPDVKAIFKSTDDALYKAKHQGRNRISIVP